MRVQRFKFLLASLAVAALAACGDSQEAKKPAPASIPAASVYDAVAAKAAGFPVGSMMAARTLYVFFDSQCPHCAALWRDSKPVLGQIRVVWIPVRLIGELSLRQGAAILSASDPAAEMEKHERLRDADGKGLQPPADLPKEALDKVRANSDLMVAIGGGAVPYLVFRAPGGASSAYEGGTDAEGLKKLLGF